jgi:predicted esterase
MLPSVRVSSRRVLHAIVAIAATAVVTWRIVPRPESLPLVTKVDGIVPADAAGVLVLLHGKGGGIEIAERMAQGLRRGGLPSNVTIVLVEGPYHTWFAHQWGDTPAQQASSRRRLRERLRELLGDRGPPPERVVIAGFSQGAGVALDVAVEEPRIGRVASLSPCQSMLRDELPKRAGLRFLLTHGSTDSVCPVDVSRSLARLLDEAHRPVRYLEFDGPHTISLEAANALVAFVTDPVATRRRGESQ